MANTLFVPSQVAATALALLRDDAPLASTINRKYESNFGGGKGSSVNVRVPATLKARRRAIDAGTAITLDNITESTVSVALTTMSYSAVPVTDEDMTLRIEDFARQVLAPQVLAIAEDIENLVIETMQALTENNTLAQVGQYAAATPGKQFTQVRKFMRDQGVPQSGLFAACGTQVYADLIESGELKDASQSGSVDALREAKVGKVRGFTTLEDNRLADDEIVFYHGDAFTLAVVAPTVPDGVAFGESMDAEGFAIRWIKDYDSSLLQDRSILSTFLGCQVMQMKYLAPNGTTSMVTPAVRIKTTTTAV